MLWDLKASQRWEGYSCSALWRSKMDASIWNPIPIFQGKMPCRFLTRLSGASFQQSQDGLSQWQISLQWNLCMTQNLLKKCSNSSVSIFWEPKENPEIPVPGQVWEILLIPILLQYTFIKSLVPDSRLRSISLVSYRSNCFVLQSWNGMRCDPNVTRFRYLCGTQKSWEFWV